MDVIKDLGDGLILRRATNVDIETVATFNSLMHLYVGATEPLEGLAVWTRDLMQGNHPTTEARDFLVVEDTRTSAIVSASCLISQVWAYGGIPFKLGRPELVATHPDYRNRGLVRTQFEVLHRWSHERSELAQAITGIRYYYRQFGYEMTVNFPARRIGYRVSIPALKEGEPEPFNVRPATGDDLPFIMGLSAEADKRYFITAVRDEATWQYELHKVTPTSEMSKQFCIIETPEGERVGALAHGARLWSGTLGVMFYELAPGVRWAAVSPSVLRYVGKKGAEYAERDKKAEFAAYIFELGDKHPVYDIIAGKLPRKPPTYPYYMRVPDLPAFIRHVAPVLEGRMAASPFAGHTGELKLNFYRSALKMTFADGKVGAEEYKAAHQEDGDVFFPNLTFLHMLFGHLELEEIEHVFADCWPANDEARALVKTLFPKKDSLVVAIS